MKFLASVLGSDPNPQNLPVLEPPAGCCLSPAPSLCPQLMFLAYLFFLVWLGVTAFTSLPVFMYFNVWSMCQNTSLVDKANLCLDLRQFGTFTPGLQYRSPPAGVFSS